MTMNLHFLVLALTILSSSVSSAQALACNSAQMSTSFSAGTLTVNYRACSDALFYFDSITLTVNQGIYASAVIRRYAPNWGTPLVITWQNYAGLVSGTKTWYPAWTTEQSLHPYVYIHYSTTPNGAMLDTPVLRASAVPPAGGGPVPVPVTSTQPCSATTKSRAGIVSMAKAIVSGGRTISYTQDLTPRWSDITAKKCAPSLPPTADCSSFLTWLFWNAYGNGPDFLNHLSWKAGATSTMINYGTAVSLASARPGDIVIYIKNGISHHAALYVGNSQVVSYGSTGPVHLYGINLGGPTFVGGYYVIHSYLP